MKELTFGTILIAIMILLFMLTPLAFIWSVNTLFSLGIAYEIKNLIAAWLLLSVSKFVIHAQLPKK